jgi:hypothetical protein
MGDQVIFSLRETGSQSESLCSRCRRFRTYVFKRIIDFLLVLVINTIAEVLQKCNEGLIELCCPKTSAQSQY